MVFLKEFFEKVDFEKNQQTTNISMQNYPVGKELKFQVAKCKGINFVAASRLKIIFGRIVMEIVCGGNNTEYGLSVGIM